jgi:hypothetical protein
MSEAGHGEDSLLLLPSSRLGFLTTLETVGHGFGSFSGLCRNAFPIGSTLKILGSISGKTLHSTEPKTPVEIWMWYLFFGEEIVAFTARSFLNDIFVCQPLVA